MPNKTFLGFVLCIIMLVSIATLFSQQAASKYKNIKVLTDVPEGDIPKIMMGYTKYLGVKCTHCHDSKDFSNDEMRNKKVARTMIQMVMDINKKYLTKMGAAEVTCNVCHRGKSEPEAI